MCSRYRINHGSDFASPLFPLPAPGTAFFSIHSASHLSDWIWRWFDRWTPACTVYPRVGRTYQVGLCCARLNEDGVPYRFPVIQCSNGVETTCCCEDRHSWPI